MRQIDLLFESSPWFIVLCLAIGIAYAGIIYYRSKGPWSQRTNIVLAVARFFFVTIICLLLLGPLIRKIFNSYEKPTIVVALDNSESIAEIESEEVIRSIVRGIEELNNQLSEREYKIELRTFDGIEGLDEIDSIQFDFKQSDINRMLEDVQNDYESRNLSNVVLISDGIYNQGNNPVYQQFNFTVHTVGIGDTTQKPDLILNELIYNKIAYQGNKFPLLVELFSIGYQDETIEVEITSKGGVIERRQLNVTSGNQFFQEQFLIEAKEKGYQQYRVSLLNKENELSVFNNSKDAFVDVIEGKEKILIAAPYPHPDIKAIRIALLENENYEVETYIEGLDPMPADQYDVYILHQIPNLRNTQFQLLNQIKNDELPVWYILGPLSHLPGFNNTNNLVDIQVINNQKDNVFPYLNPNFTTFGVGDDSDPVFRKYPPVSVPFANYTISLSADILLKQKVGSIQTDKPLFVFGGNSQKEAVLIGSGTWQWRLAEYAQNESTASFDELVTKTIQFLSAKDDKRKLRVYPIKPEFFDNESVVFETEAYNDIYERIYGHEINLTLTDENGNSTGYQYVTSEANSRYTINNLPTGVYRYEANAIVSGKNESSSGSFIIKEMQIEQTRLRADHQMLKNLALENGGAFYHLNESDQLLQNLTTQKAQSVIHSQEDYLSIINLKWVFFLILFLFSLEWFLRKYHGSY